MTDTDQPMVIYDVCTTCGEPVSYRLTREWEHDDPDIVVDHPAKAPAPTGPEDSRWVRDPHGHLSGAD